MKLYQKLILIFVILIYSNWINGQPPFYTPREEDVVTMAWNHTGDLLVVGYHSGEVSLFSQNGDFLQVIQFYDNRITAMAWSPDDTKLIMSSGAGGGETIVVELWNTTDWVSQPIDYDSSDMITSFVWNPDNNYIYAGTGNFNSSHGKTLWVWDSNGQFIEAFRKSSIMGLSISPDGQKIAIGGDNIQILDADTYEEIARFSSTDHFSIYMVTNFFWTPDSSKLISANLHGSIQMWDMNILSPTPLIELLANTYTPPYPWLESNVRDLYLKRNELYVISGNGLVRVWNIAPDKPELLKHQFLEIARPLRSARFNPLTHQIAYQGIDDNIEIAPIEIIYNISVSPDGNKILAYKDSTIDIINSNTLQTITSIPIDSSKIAIWSPDSNYLAINIHINAVEGDILEVWDTNTGLLVTTLDGHGDNNALEWAGNILYSMTFDGLLLIWDMNTYEIIHSFSIGGNDLEISPNGDKLAIASFLNIAILDLNTMTLESFVSQEEQILSVAWSPDGQKIASSSVDGKIKIWNLNNRNAPERIIFANNVNYEIRWITELQWNDGYLAVRQMYNDSVVILDDQTGEELDTILVENGRFIWSGNTGYYATFKGDSIQLHQYCDEITQPENVSHISQEIISGNTSIFGNTICLAPNATYTLTTALPTITGDITLIGNGARLISADNQPLFDVADGGNLTLKDVVISGGAGE